MYTKTQLEVIRIFGRKELSFGCLVLLKDNTDAKVNYYYICKDSFDGDSIFIETFEEGYENTILEYEKEEYEILGHIPHLEDVFRVAKENLSKRGQKFDIALYQMDDCIFKIYDCQTYREEEKTIKGFDASIPLLEQDESTLLELLKLFK